MTNWDVILVGGGLANGLIAWRLRQRQPGLKVLMLEAGERAGGNHTWSFHEDDLTPAQHEWLAPLVAHRWQGYEVRFPRFTRTLPGGYLSVTAESFARALETALGENLLTSCAVNDITPHGVTLADGLTLHAEAV
ncbi:lycopene cyclase family protein, partial [Erwinia sp.]|uniref:lycopene cyclase family protein n=1 Tax=Erwinia citreus TaxID=558 RepID=UPI00289FC7E6